MEVHTGGRQEHEGRALLDELRSRPCHRCPRDHLYGFLSPVSGTEAHLDPKVAADPLIFPPPDALKRGERTVRNETYDRRVAILTKFKAAAAQ